MLSSSLRDTVFAVGRDPAESLNATAPGRAARFNVGEQPLIALATGACAPISGGNRSRTDMSMANHGCIILLISSSTPTQDRPRRAHAQSLRSSSPAPLSLGGRRPLPWRTAATRSRRAGNCPSGQHHGRGRRTGRRRRRWIAEASPVAPCVPLTGAQPVFSIFLLPARLFCPDSWLPSSSASLVRRDTNAAEQLNQPCIASPGRPSCPA